MRIPVDHRECECGLVEDHSIVWCIEEVVAAKVSPQDRFVCLRLGKLETSWLYRHHRSLLSKVHDPGKYDVRQKGRWVIFCK
jgi:hypothetical protein